MTLLAILTAEQIAVSVVCAVILVALWYGAERYERWRGKTWRVEDDDGYVVTSLYEFRKDRK